MLFKFAVRIPFKIFFNLVFVAVNLVCALTTVKKLISAIMMIIGLFFDISVGHVTHFLCSLY